MPSVGSGQIINDLNDWDKYQISHEASFTQSSYWYEFNKVQGGKPLLFKGSDWSALCIERQTPFGSYWLIPYGPTFDNQKALDNALSFLTQEAKVREIKWLRYEPVRSNRKESSNITLRGKKWLSTVEPELTLVNDLTQPEADLWRNIGSTNRNLVNRARKTGVECKTSYDPKDIKLFTDMQKTVADRTQVGFHSPEYYIKQAEVLMPKKRLSLEIAYFEGKPMATVLLNSFGNTVYYTHAASYPEARDNNSAIMLTWHCIEKSKKEGFKNFDFWGIAPDTAPDNHPWKGFTHYKRKFGGDERAFSGTWDIALSPVYQVYRFAQKLRKLL